MKNEGVAYSNLSPTQGPPGFGLWDLCEAASQTRPDPLRDESDEITVVAARQGPLCCQI